MADLWEGKGFQSRVHQSPARPPTLPVRPPPKATDSYSEATHALDNIIREQERQMAAPHAR